MNLIKTYLLPLCLLLFFTVSSLAQSDSNYISSDSAKVEMSKTDSVLVNCYFSEKEYNRIHGIDRAERIDGSEEVYEDEIYNGKKEQKKRRSNFWDNVPAELVVDVVVNTLFFVAILWQ